LDVHSSGPLDKKAVVAAVSSPACVVKSYSVGGFRVTRLTADAARLVYRAEQHTTCAGHPVPSPSWIQSIYVRRDGRWQNAGFQVTDAANPERLPADPERRDRIDARRSAPPSGGHDPAETLLFVEVLVG